MSNSTAGPVSQFIRAQIARLLDAQRVVVWYDGERAFEGLVGRLALEKCVLVRAGESVLRARREADAAYRAIERGDGEAGSRQNLLIYLPRPRGTRGDEQLEDPFEGFARCGVAFGDDAGETLLALAQRAMPERADEIARLFRNGMPGLEVLDALPSGARYPLVRQALGSESPSEIIVAALSRADAAARLGGVPGALAELGQVLCDSLGFAPASGGALDAWRESLVRFLLVSELAEDLPTGLPAALATVPRAPAEKSEVVAEIGRRLRESAAGQELLRRLAPRIEEGLHLATALETVPAPGHRDIFPIQERRRFQRVVERAGVDLSEARALDQAAEDSLWRRQPERAPLWRVVGRCLAFLDLAAAAEDLRLPTTPRGLIDAYIAADGLWRLDHAQRRFEQAAAQCAGDDELDPLVQKCRTRYREVSARIQGAFLRALGSGAWPVEGLRRQTQVFDTHVAPALAERRKVAYFLVDSLRYEMGRDLAEGLERLGAVRLEAACATLPTTTPFGMAALLPGADGTIDICAHGGELVPALGDTPLPHLDARRAVFRQRYGDRYRDLTLAEVVAAPPRRLAQRMGSAQLAVIRTTEIDELGEGGSARLARRHMSEVVGELVVAARRLAQIGFETQVFAADHGHLLVPETLPGDVVAPPPGDWPLRKRRALLGQHRAEAAGVLIFPASQVGIVGPGLELAVPSGFNVFQAGAEYFHEGLSLPECLVPVVVATVRPENGQALVDQVTISYKRDRFTTGIIGLTLALISINPTATIRLDAVDSADSGRVAGRAGDCDARDDATGAIVLRAGVETAVPLVIDADFAGSGIVVRALDPGSGALLARLPLKNARLD